MEKPAADCAIRDDMDPIREDILESDPLIFGTPVHMGYAAAIMPPSPKSLVKSDG